MHAKHSEWDFAASAEYILLTHLYNLTHQVNSKKKLKSSELLPLPKSAKKEKVGTTSLPLNKAHALFKRFNKDLPDL